MQKPSLGISIMGKGGPNSRPQFPSFGKKPEPDTSGAPASPTSTADAKDEEVESAGGVNIKPEAVCFRTADQVCSSCEYREDDGNCKVLGQAVQDGDSCNAYESKDEGVDAGMGLGMADEPMSAGGMRQ